MNTDNLAPSMEHTSSAKKVIIACILLLALVAGGVFAYLTATDEKVNNLSIANELNIEVVEPNWNPDAAKNLEPGMSVTKDPAIHNLTGVEAYAFVEVSIPKYNGNDQLFSFIPSPDWHSIDLIENDDNYVHVYAYNVELEGNATTTPIFSSVKVSNFKNGEVNAANQEIVVTGHAIQAEGIKDVVEAWTIYKSTLDTTTYEMKNDIFFADYVYDAKLSNYTGSYMPMGSDMAYSQKGIRKIEFSDVKAPDGVEIIDFDADGDGGVVAWTQGNTFYVSTQKAGQKVIMNNHADNLWAMYPINYFTLLTSGISVIDCWNLDMSNVTDLHGMFLYCEDVTSINNITFTDKPLTNIYGAFYRCNNLQYDNSLTSGIENWNVSQLTTVTESDSPYSNTQYGTFGYVTMLDVDLTGWDVSNITNYSMFAFESGPGIIEPNWADGGTSKY